MRLYNDETYDGRRKPPKIFVYLREEEYKKYQVNIRKIGKLEDWKIGKLGNWKIGKLENWKIQRYQEDKSPDSKKNGFPCLFSIGVPAIGIHKSNKDRGLPA